MRGHGFPTTHGWNCERGLAASSRWSSVVLRRSSKKVNGLRGRIDFAARRDLWSKLFFQNLLIIGLHRKIILLNVTQDHIAANGIYMRLWSVVLCVYSILVLWDVFLEGWLCVLLRRYPPTGMNRHGVASVGLPGHGMFMPLQLTGRHSIPSLGPCHCCYC